MKPALRVIGFDDAPFSFDQARVPVVGAVVRGSSLLENVVRTDVAVDGEDATDRLADSVASCPQRPDLRAVLVDGAALGGFNVVDPDALRQRTGLPVLTVTRGEPDWEAMEAALRKHHVDWERRWRILSVRPEPYPTAGQPLYVRAAGIGRREVAELLAHITAVGHVPEALRIAHLVARVVGPG